MVRTQSPQYGFSIDTSRVLALSTAIALHVLAACLLLIPLSRRALPDLPEPPPPRWQIPERITPPPAPPQPIQSPAAPTPPAAVAPMAPVAPQPIADAAPAEAQPAEPAYSLPLAETATPPASVAPSLPGAALRYLQAPPPAYPRAALAARQQGTVLLQVRVGTEGQPLEVTIVRSSGSRVLDQAARAQVLRHWRFQPAMQDGRSVEAVGLVPVDFSLAQ